MEQSGEIQTPVDFPAVWAVAARFIDIRQHYFNILDRVNDDE